MNAGIQKARLLSESLRDGLVWWWRTSGVKVHHLLAFVATQSIGAALITFRLGVMEVNQGFFVNSTYSPMGVTWVGGVIIFAAVVMVLSAAALLDTRFQIPLGIVIFAYRWWTPATPSGYTIRLPQTSTFEEIAFLWGPRVLLVSFAVTLIMVCVIWIRALARKIDSWFEKKVHRLAETSTAPGQTSSTSMFSVVALLLSPLIPLLGFILGYIALNDIAIGAGEKKGKDMAIASIIISSILLVLSLLFAFVWLLGTFWAIGPLA